MTDLSPSERIPEGPDLTNSRGDSFEGMADAYGFVGVERDAYIERMREHAAKRSDAPDLAERRLAHWRKCVEMLEAERERRRAVEAAAREVVEAFYDGHLHGGPERIARLRAVLSDGEER